MLIRGWIDGLPGGNGGSANGALTSEVAVETVPSPNVQWNVRSSDPGSLERPVRLVGPLVFPRMVSCPLIVVVPRMSADGSTLSNTTETLAQFVPRSVVTSSSCPQRRTVYVPLSPKVTGTLN